MYARSVLIKNVDEVEWRKAKMKIRAYVRKILKESES